MMAKRAVSREGASDRTGGAKLISRPMSGRLGGFQLRTGCHWADLPEAFQEIGLTGTGTLPVFECLRGRNSRTPCAIASRFRGGAVGNALIWIGRT